MATTNRKAKFFDSFVFVAVQKLEKLVMESNGVLGLAPLKFVKDSS